MSARPRLVVLNPNTNENVTHWLAEEVRRMAGSAFEIIAVNADSGLAALETPSDIEGTACLVASEFARHKGAMGRSSRPLATPALRLHERWR